MTLTQMETVGRSDGDSGCGRLVQRFAARLEFGDGTLPLPVCRFGLYGEGMESATVLVRCPR